MAVTKPRIDQTQNLTSTKYEFSISIKIIRTKAYCITVSTAKIKIKNAGSNKQSKRKNIIK